MIGIFIGLPILLWATGDFPRRTYLKESLSILFILSFCLMLGQFFLARSNRSGVSGIKMSMVLKIHKAIGYIFVSVLLIHPFLIVVPRYFEGGIEPMEAFTTLITTIDSLGVVLGMVAWSLMLILGITSIMRKSLPMTYGTWRIFHGILSIVFIAVATWHAVDLGRHTDFTMSVFLITLAASGVVLLLRTYVLKPSAGRNSD